MGLFWVEVVLGDCLALLLGFGLLKFGRRVKVIICLVQAKIFKRVLLQSFC